MTFPGTVLGIWSGLVFVLAFTYRLRDAAARLRRPSEPPAAPAPAAATLNGGLSRWERDRRVAATLLLSAVSIVSAWGWGAALLRILAPGALTPLLHLLFAVTLGWGVQSHAFLLLGLAGRLRRPWAALLLAAGLALAGAMTAWSGGAAAAGAATPAGAWTPAALIAALFCAAVVCAILPACFTPPRGFDAHAYHLELPRRYAEAGRLSYVPFMAHSPWPQAGHMLFLPGFFFRCSHFPQVISALCGIVLAGLAFEIARAGAGLEAGFLAALLVLGVGELVFQMSEPTVDVALALFTMAGVSAWACWLATGDAALLILSGLFAGLACSTKMTALLLVALLGAACLVSGFLSGAPAGGLAEALIAPGVAALVAAPWYARSAWLTGNPVFHFATGIFTTRNWAPSSEAAHRAVAAANGWGPVRGARQWGRYAMRHLVESPIGWGTGLIGLGPAAVMFPLPAAAAAAGMLSLGLALATLVQTDQIRLMLGSAAGMAAAVGAAAASIGGALPEAWRTVVTALLGVLALSGALHALHQKLRAVRGADRRASYLRRFLPYYDDFLWMNAHLPAESRVLLWTTRGFLLERDYVWLPPWQQGIFDFTRIADAGAFRDELRRRGVTHVYYTDREISRALFGWLHEMHDEMVRNGFLVEDAGFAARGALYKVV
jgi:hypothetical protein